MPYLTHRRSYLAGEKYADQGGSWYDVDPVYYKTSDVRALRIQHQMAVRAGTPESRGNPLISGYSLPFVWTVVQTELRCDGSSPAVVTYSKMPSISVYRDGAQVFTDRQTGDWGGFVNSGNRGRVFVGHGKLYKPCSAHGFGLPAGATLTPDCSGLTSGEPSWSGFTT